MRPITLYRNSTRLCVERTGECSIVSGAQAKIILERVGEAEYVPMPSCPPALYRPCVIEPPPPPGSPVPPPEPLPVANAWSATLSLVEQRDDGSLCALITSELKYLRPGRYVARVTGVSPTPYCFAVDLKEARPNLHLLAETPFSCAPCDDDESCAAVETQTEEPPTFWER